MKPAPEGPTRQVSTDFRVEFRILIIFHNHLRLLVTALLVLAVYPAAHAEDKPAPPKIEDFTFIHISDTHINPHVASLGPPEKPRGIDCINWICEETRKPQKLEPFNMEVSAPEFGIVTGDLTEYGVIDDTWEQWEAAFKCMNFPLYVTTGNHDNTWTAIYQVMRKRHGGENYSFDKHGCHFAMISSASPQEPLPSFDGKTRAWLKADLDKLAPGTPVFIGFHHPPNSDEFAPAELDTFLDLIKNYNVVLLLYGHGHGVSHWEKDGIDGVMGGSTFGGKNEGYSIVSVKDGMLRVGYRYRNADEKETDKESGNRFKKLLEKQFERVVPDPRLELNLIEPTDGGEEFLAVVNFKIGTAQHAKIEVGDIALDGKRVEKSKVRLEPTPEGDIVLIGIEAPQSLVPGMHLLAIRASAGDQADQRAQPFQFLSARFDRDKLWTRQTLTAIKAGVVRLGSLVLVAGTDGSLRALETTSGHDDWTYNAGAEILTSPLPANDLILFGTGDGYIHAVDAEGKLRWKHDAKAACYAPIVRDGDVLYAGDNQGRMHALNIADGKPKWVFERADFSIESAAVIWKDYVVFGAWDGHVYALNRSDGKFAWKSLGPESSKGKAARYFSPADCSPVPIGDKLFVCDRGYKLGVYDYEGKLLKEIGEKIAAIGPARGDKGETIGFYARGTENKLWKFDKDGERVWQVDVPAGRFPIPPTEHDGKVYVCSNIGLLSVLDAKDGKLLWQYQCTPGFYVMAPVSVAPDGTCYVAGMDGSITAVRRK